MRNFKKLLCLVLALAVVMSSFTAFSREYLAPYKFMEDVFRFDVGDFAADAEGAEGEADADVNRIKLLATLGIWDNAELSKDALISMTEFSIIMSNLRLGAENALKGVYSKEENKDEAKATYKNAFQHLLESLGYYYRCAQYGNSDESLLIVAADIGLISENPENINAFITRGELAKLISKALTIDLCTMEYTSTGGYKYTVAQGKNLLNSIHGIYEIGGFVNAIPGLAIYGGSSVREGYIQIERRNVNTNGLDLNSFLGSRVIAYAEYDAQINEYSILYINYADDYTVTEIDFSDIISIKKGVVSYYDETGAELEIDAGELTYITENGCKLDSIDDMSDFTKNEGKIIFTSSLKKGDIDTAIIYVYNYFVVGYVDVNNFKIGVQFNQEYNGREYLQINDKSVNNITIDGVKADYSQLLAGHTIRYFTCADTGYTEIISKTKKVEGEITSIYEDVVNISDIDYRKSKDLYNIIERGENDAGISASEKVKDLELGMTTTFYVFDNILVGYVNTNTYKWGYLRSISKARTSIDPDLTLSILTDSGEWSEFKVTDKFELDGEPAVTKEEFLKRVNNNPDMYNNIVRYKSGSENKLTALDTVEISRYETDSPDDVELCLECPVVLNWTNEWLCDTDYNDLEYYTSPSTIAFIAPAGEDDISKFKCTNVSALPKISGTNGGTPLKMYTPDDVGLLGAVVCTMDPDDADSGGSSGATLFVENIRYAILDADNLEFGYRISGKTLVASASDPNGGYLKEVSYMISETMINKNTVEQGNAKYDVKKIIEVGDLVSVSALGGKVTMWSMLLKEGRVPPLASETEDTEDKDMGDSGETTGFRGQGIIQKVNTVTNFMRVKFDDSNIPILARVKVIIDPDAHTITQITAADYNEGERIFTNVQYGRAGYVIKNPQ